MRLKKKQPTNKFIVKKNKSKLNSKSVIKLPIALESLLNKFKRNKFSSLKFSTLFSFAKSLLGKRKKLITYFFVIIIISILIAIFAFLRLKSNQIQIQSFVESEEKLANLYNNKTQNILFVNFKEGSDSNKFAEYISILSFDKTNNNLKILAVEPSLSIYYKNKAYTLKTLYNNINENIETKTSIFKNSIAGLLGVRIDGYFFTENEAYSNFIKTKNLGLTLNENYKVDNKFYKIGEFIQGEDLLKYLHIIESEEIIESSLYRNNLFVTNMLQSNRNILFTISSFFQADLFTNTFKTNLDKDSALRFYNDIFFQSNLPIQSQYIQIKDGYFIDTFAGKGLYVNQIDIDNKVQEVFRDLDIVREQAKIEVLNASKVSGLATINKKIIQNSGGNVVNSGNYSTIEENTTLYLIDSNIKDYANTISLIQSLYPNVVIKDSGYKYNKLGNIILIIGEN